jgi:CRP-like cAMP-binding protein
MNDVMAPGAPATLGVKNAILRALPRSELDRLAPFLHPVEIKPRQMLHHANTPMEQVYFIENGLVSVSGKAAAAKWVEVWLIGSEGMTGIPVVLGDDDEPPLRRTVQVGGSALRIGRSDLRRAMERSPALRSVLLRYVEMVLLQTSQASACNATHDLKQRLSRWLLLARDALDDDTIHLTHQVLARLLGVRRPSVSQCLGVLESEGVLRNSRGRIEVTDPEKLQTASCDCSRVIRREYARLLGVRRRA